MDDDPWVEYARLQSMLDRTTDAYKAAGIEAAMSDFLEKLSEDDFLSKKQVKNLVDNRCGKERRHRATIHTSRYELADECSPPDAAESRITLQKCQQACGDRDFDLLLNKAAGHSYVDLSRQTGLNQNTLKTLVSRARQKIMPLAA